MLHHELALGEERLVRAQLDAPDGRELRVLLPDGIRRANVAVSGQAPIDLPLPDGVAIVPRASSPGARTVVITSP